MESADCGNVAYQRTDKVCPYHKSTECLATYVSTERLASLSLLTLFSMWRRWRREVSDDHY